MKPAATFEETPITKVSDYWNARPCNIRHSTKPVGSKEYFDEVEARKYFVEAHIPRLVQAPIRLRQPLGDVVVRRGDQELGRVAVVAEREVPATGWLSFWNSVLDRGVQAQCWLIDKYQDG